MARMLLPGSEPRPSTCYAHTRCPTVSRVGCYLHALPTPCPVLPGCVAVQYSRVCTDGLYPECTLQY
eukprot:3834055-Rhodomonas_salina.3